MKQPRNGGAKAPTTKGPVFFWMPAAPFGEFCQWFLSPFVIKRSEIASLLGTDDTKTESDDVIKFNCAEQFMMYCKAGRFHDTKTQKLILANDSPKEQKRLGGIVAGFVDSSWDKVKSEVVVAGNIAKFGQNLQLKGKLLGTGDRLMVEAAPNDRVWGIGYNEKRAMNFQENWGENRLGKALIEAREHLRHDVAS